MKEYNLFHSMVAKPSIAQTCIDSFVKSTGCILFMPSFHKDDEIYRYDASHDNALTLWSYYALVLYSFTWLSTFLGMTDTIDIQDYTDSGGLTIWPFEDGKAAPAETKSSVNPRVHVRKCVFKYVQRHKEMFNLKEKGADAKAGELKLQRRFEYNFRLSGGLNVIMLHLSSSDCPDVLHLVEVYEFTNPILRFIAEHSFSFLTWIFVGNNEKLKQA